MFFFLIVLIFVICEAQYLPLCSSDADCTKGTCYHSARDTKLKKQGVCVKWASVQFDSRDFKVNLPAQVYAKFSLQDAEGTPIGGLTEADFDILIDGSLLPPTESQQRIFPEEATTSFFITLVVDQSDSARQHLTNMVAAVGHLVRETTADAKVTINFGVFAFTGNQRLTQVVSFTSDVDAVIAGVHQLQNDSWVSSHLSDRGSTNLYGAFLEGIDTSYTQTFTKGEAMFTQGALVVVTDGVDTADRVSREDAQKAIEVGLDKHNTIIKVVAVGSDMKGTETLKKMVGESHVVPVQDYSALTDHFTKLADMFSKRAHAQYVLTHCSPKRANTHEVRLAFRSDSTVLGEIPDLSITKEFVHAFSAENFTGGCTVEKQRNPCILYVPPGAQTNLTDFVPTPICGNRNGYNCPPCVVTEEQDVSDVNLADSEKPVYFVIDSQLPGSSVGVIGKDLTPADGEPSGEGNDSKGNDKKKREIPSLTLDKFCLYLGKRSSPPTKHSNLIATCDASKRSIPTGTALSKLAKASTLEDTHDGILGIPDVGEYSLLVTLKDSEGGIPFRITIGDEAAMAQGSQESHTQVGVHTTSSGLAIPLLVLLIAGGACCCCVFMCLFGCCCHHCMKRG